MTFQIGDKIVMKQNVPYTYSSYKSTGTIVNIDETHVEVSFDFLATEFNGTREPIWWVDIAHCKFVERSPQPTQQEKVCAKIQLMEARWLKFQANKRSCHA